MGILDDLTPPNNTNRCAVFVAKTDLDEQDKDALETAVNNPKWPAATLAVALKQKGITINRWAIADHRRKICKCWKI